jgi:hypothetical protein
VRENSEGKFDFKRVVLLEAAARRTTSWKRVDGAEKMKFI